ncbi:NADPH2:quinone reductase [Stella humosa]|uniref:NADPH2:quinone reductase n=1 Tax=Stella humosa TaxID=94 RepID=A0A3N1LGZ1_9PROT|nr:NADPH:quinone oxidoreductase family protein [Stella humosa]ROP90510.1 NADPH2:quinone reductase [Stella humosa]BBK29597.1 NADPH:quinone oxidoreductase [Stella humosa]
MRAVRCHAYGDLANLSVDEVPVPDPGPGQVRVAVHAVGINFADGLMVLGQYQEKPPLPFVPGLEAAGIVEACGEGVTRVRPGDRVAALVDTGAYAEYLVAPEDRLFPVPDGMDLVTAASFPVVYGTSHVALDRRARLQPGETLLVHGAAGGVGLTAVEIGRAMGATVIASASSPEKLAVAALHGAGHLIDYSHEDLRARVREITDGRGADVIYDPVGGDVFDTSLRCIAWEGRLIVIGFASGRIPQAPANILLVKNISVIGLFWGAYRQRDPQVVRDSLDTLFGWYGEGKLKPHISHRLDLAEAAAGIGLLRDRQSTGKVVLTTGRTE